MARKLELSRSLHNDGAVLKPEDVADSAYVSVVPTLSSAHRLIQWLRAGISDMDLLETMACSLYGEAHVTIMYSRKQGIDLTKIPDPAKLTSYMYYGKALLGKIKEFEYWDGHNDKGYLVAKLDSPELCALNEKWKQLGLKHSFDDYTPHVTIVSPFAENAPMVAALNQRLIDHPLSMEFLNEKIEPLNKD